MSAELRALAEAAGPAGFCRTLHVGSDGRRQEVCITGHGILALLDERDAAIRRARKADRLVSAIHDFRGAVNEAVRREFDDAVWRAHEVLRSQESRKPPERTKP